jgi:hypothetical protein
MVPLVMQLHIQRRPALKLSVVVRQLAIQEAVGVAKALELPAEGNFTVQWNVLHLRWTFKDPEA